MKAWWLRPSQLIGFPIRDWNKLQWSSDGTFTSQLIGFPIRDWNWEVCLANSGDAHRNWLDSLLGIETPYLVQLCKSKNYRNWLDSLLGIETFGYMEPKDKDGNRNWLDSLLGIETTKTTSALVSLAYRNWLDSLLGIETMRSRLGAMKLRSQLIGFPIRDWNWGGLVSPTSRINRNWLDSLLGIETWCCAPWTPHFSYRNWLDSLLGIETVFGWLNDFACALSQLIGFPIRDWNKIFVPGMRLYCTSQLIGFPIRDWNSLFLLMYLLFLIIAIDWIPY